jgi:hypothetical protein
MSTRQAVGESATDETFRITLFVGEQLPLHRLDRKLVRHLIE